jgi:predicted DNA-binding antitoxin AbrB/MazE fold protein
MTKQLDVIYKGGAFFPLSPLQGISEGDKVQISLLNVIRAVPEEEDSGALERAVARMTSRTAEEIEATRARLFAEMELPTPLPPGKTLEDVISGKWPGDETDEEVRLALEKLS